MGKDNIISIEDGDGHYQSILGNFMRMVPRKDRSDIALIRLLAFRLRIDGEDATRRYLMRKIRTMSQCAYHGRMYDFLKNDQRSKACRFVEHLPDPPDSA